MPLKLDAAKLMEILAEKLKDTGSSHYFPIGEINGRAVGLRVISGRSLCDTNHCLSGENDGQPPVINT